eukprot:14065141-Ditylum_brightwellii.AAC.1
MMKETISLVLDHDHPDDIIILAVEVVEGHVLHHPIIDVVEVPTQEVAAVEDMTAMVEAVVVLAVEAVVVAEVVVEAVVVVQVVVNYPVMILPIIIPVITVVEEVEGDGHVPMIVITTITIETENGMMSEVKGEEGERIPWS